MNENVELCWPHYRSLSDTTGSQLDFVPLSSTLNLAVTESQHGKGWKGP